MNVEEATRAALLAASPVTAIVGAGGVYVSERPHSQPLPYAIVSLQTCDPHVTLGGTSGKREYTVDVDCFAKSPTQSAALSLAVAAQFADYSGNGIDAVVWLDEGRDRVLSADGSEVDAHVLTHTYSVIFEEQ